MVPPKRLGRFLLVSVLVYGALMAPWPGLASGYSFLFRACGNAFFARFWLDSAGSVRFLNLDNLQPGDVAPGTPELRATGPQDIAMELRSRRAPGSLGYMLTSSRYVGYSPTVVLLALMAATPIPRRRWAWRLFAGLAFVHAFIALRLTLTLLANGFAAAKDYALFSPSPFWRDVLTEVESVLSDDPTVSLIVPVLIWVIVAGRATAADPKSAPAATPSARR